MTSEQQKSTTPTAAKIIYILLLISTVVGFTGIIALIMAYVFKDNTTDWLQTHYRFQIRTYWIGLLYTVVGLITLTITIGYLILMFTFIWMVVRCAKGLKQLESGQPVNNLESWLFT